MSKYTDDDLRYTIINVHSRLKHKYRKIPFWGFIVDICGKGSSLSIELCEYFGWNPHEDTIKVKFH